MEYSGEAPEELTRAPLRRLAEGVGKAVYASRHWVVKRERSATAILALIVMWKLLRRLARLLPARVGERLLRRPSRPIRFLRVCLQAVVVVIPRSVWMMTHAGRLWRMHRSRDVRGEQLAREHLADSDLIPRQVTFPPTRVKVLGWPGWLVVSAATERVDETLFQRLHGLGMAGRFEELELWLDRFLQLRQSGWQRGLFSIDPHLKNYGVTGERVVLLDSGGLTDNWPEIEARLSTEATIEQPHVQLGLGRLLESRPDIAQRFNARWKDVVSPAGVRRNWPEESH